MSWFLPARAERKAADQADLYRTILSDWFGGYSSKSGVAITHKLALECITVLACCRVIAEGIAQVPWKLMRQTGERRQVATDDGLHDLINLEPNDWQTSFELRETIALHLALARNALVFVNRVRGDRIVELLPFVPGDIQIVMDAAGRVIEGYRLTGSGNIIPRANVWHLRGLSWDGMAGLDGVKLAREAIGLDKVMEGHSAGLFRNATTASGVLQTDQALTPERAKELHEQWQERYAGPENAGKTPVLHSGLKWQTIAMTALDAQLLEQRRFEVERICASWRVLPIMIGMDGKTNSYSSVEQMGIWHAVHTLGPWFERIRQSADKNLLTKDQRRRGYYTQFVVQGLMQAAHTARADFYSKALGAGGGPAWMTQDEIRDLEDLNPMGGDAGKLPIPSNVGTKPNAGNANG